MKPERLDHVALWLSDREDAVRRVMSFIEVQILDETGDFTLLGADREVGKLTLFDAPGPREQSQMMHVAFRAPEGENAEEIQIGALHLLRIVTPGASTSAELDHLALRVPDPERSATRWRELGFEAADPRIAPGARVRLGDAFVDLYPGTALPTDRPLLNHLGALVESIDPYLDGSVGIDLEILDTVDAPNSRSVFVQAPDGVRLEYIEHKPSFTEQQAQPISSRTR